MNAPQFFTLHGPNGLEAEISTLGAKITRLIVPNRDGERADIILGFNTPEEWLTQETYFNAIIGRYANRIKHGRFTLDGKDYQLPINNGGNSLHGGIEGFNAKLWDVVEQADDHIVLHYLSPDGEEGYPGNLDVHITYALTADNALSLTYEATTDKPTIVGFTNHAYFNLNGESSPSVRNHSLQVLADEYTPFDDTNCPLGEIVPVEGTPMDFRKPVLVGERINLPFFAPGRGIDNNWVLRPPTQPGEPQLAAVVSASGRTMQVWTTHPGLQVYTGNFVEEHVGKSGTLYGPQNSICLETQNYPDAPNQPHFPSPVLRPGEKHHHVTLFKFV